MTNSHFSINIIVVNLEEMPQGLGLDYDQYGFKMQIFIAHLIVNR